MGVTIHYEGQLIDEEAFCGLVDVVLKFSDERGWATERIESQEVTLLRVRDEKEWDYVGPVKGVAIYPHVDCDSICLEFDRDLYLQEFTKTQFAGAEIHVKVIELLKAIRPFFRELKIEDEGEYQETGDLQLLRSHIEWARNAIEAELRKNPSAQVKVKTPDGKIIDLLT